jgi:DNA polymerase III subunit gamma/tau
MTENYVVLARKYRPTNFAQLKGQNFMVQTIVNAIKLNRVAHTFLLTGIRGGGKTTTARIIARTLNCTNPKSKDDFIIPCYECDNCKSSLAGNHPDIIELDAASRTGVDDMRSIIENTSYLPLLGKYKIFIIDEVHMLSNSAFNSLLKTLEEPPSHVKFIFATTEIRKVPVTILSRCQKFELRRLSNEELVSHLKEVLSNEGISAQEDALEIIASHSQGSVRDSLSLLDLVISNSNQEEITKNQVIGLLGLNDVAQVIELIKFIVEGNVHLAIENIKNFYYSGKDLLSLPQQMMELIHHISKIKLKLEVKNFELSQNELQELEKLAERLNIETLTILWQMLLKGQQELQQASSILISAEMLIIKLCHLSNIPSPSALISKMAHPQAKTSTSDNFVEKKNSESINSPQNFEELVQLFYKKREMLLYHYLTQDVNLVEFSPCRVKILQNNAVPNNFASKVANFLSEWTGEKWQISVSNEREKALPSLSEQASNAKIEDIENLTQEEFFKEILLNFPDAKITDVLKN